MEQNPTPDKQLEVLDDIGFALQSIGMSHFLNLEKLEVLSLYADSEWDADDFEEIEANPERYIAIEPLSIITHYHIMENFTEEIKTKQPEIGDQLLAALDRKRPLARFRNLILELDLQKAFHSYQKEYYLQQAKKWVAQTGVEI